MEQLSRIQKRIKQLQRLPQSVSIEEELVELRWQVEEIYARRTLRAIPLARLLLDSYIKCGSMQVILPDGRRVECKPTYGGSAIQHFWNARADAENLAYRATPFQY